MMASIGTLADVTDMGAPLKVFAQRDSQILAVPGSTQDTTT